MAIKYSYPGQAISETKDKLYHLGREVKQENWQSTKSPDNTWELLNHSLGFQIPIDIEQLRLMVRPNLPWADMQFEERVGGEPLNPGESFKEWPHYKNTNYSDDTHREKDKFSHTYMERFWPKNKTSDLERGGIRFKYGDYQDVKRLLAKDPSTRQAFLPIWFPEDTGVVHGERVPCSLGYHFIIRNGFIHLTYYIRSCDFLRHFRDDIYMACRMVYDICEYIKKSSDIEILPGLFTMHIVSLHVFMKERGLLRQSNT